MRLGAGAVALVAPQPRPACCCDGAKRFADWIGKHLAQLASPTEPTDYQVVLAKAHLLDQFLAERAIAPKAHRERVANAQGYRCLLGLFLEAAAQIAALERARDPLALPKRPPKPPAAPAPASLGGAQVAQVLGILGKE